MARLLLQHESGGRAHREAHKGAHREAYKGAHATALLASTAGFTPLMTAVAAGHIEVRGLEKGRREMGGWKGEERGQALEGEKERGEVWEGRSITPPPCVHKSSPSKPGPDLGSELLPGAVRIQTNHVLSLPQVVRVLLAEGGLCGEALDGGPCVGKGRGPVWGAVGIAAHSGRYKHSHFTSIKRQAYRVPCCTSLVLVRRHKMDGCIRV